MGSHIGNGVTYRKWGHIGNGVKSMVDPCSKLKRVNSRLDPLMGLDMERFEKDRNSKQIATQIQSEQAHAAKHKLTGTPAFLVNGVAIKGAYPAEYFARVIDRLLKDDEAANQ